MNYTCGELEIIKGVRGIKGCESFTEEECLEVWEESILIGIIVE